jgi:hypothetical protein
MLIRVRTGREKGRENFTMAVRNYHFSTVTSFQFMELIVWVTPFHFTIAHFQDFQNQIETCRSRFGLFPNRV